MTETRPARGYRFGVFEANAASGELLRQGIRVKLNAQPFQVLCMLLERPGELLTREAISHELWPEGTFVDYEHGVNSAVNRIREALGDTAGNPRFIETLARRGYRFVAPVERIDLDKDLSPLVCESPSPEPTAPPATAIEPADDLLSRILASPQELPKTSYPVVQTLFVLFQCMYLSFYIGALANLAEIEDLFAALPKATQALIVLIVTAAVLIPVRAFILTAVLMHAPRIRRQFLRIWPFLFLFDELWSLR